MVLHETATPTDPRRQRRLDAGRLRRALTCSLIAILVLLLIHALGGGEHPALTVQPHSAGGLVGILTAPLLHGSWDHVLSNAIAVLILGTLAGSVYPRASLRALPLLWLGSGLSAWLLGAPGEHHLGASGITQGLMLMTLVLGIVRREQAAVAAAMIVYLLYGGALLTVLPLQPGVSWQSHLGGAIAGVVAALLFRHADPPPPRRVYSYELEDEAAADHDPELMPQSTNGPPSNPSA
ncbi:rhomboid family intramembrane serine protease [Solilutibacter silvestris]|uniref:Rhomboid family n=1 Tax=Solilutibacter silvestris TaxID=1645665 RepID=A0A2K1Q153_9GAMM|nr:rhomboid family intramembrane serine protease [Lysobacter silvestris]PNS08778.1 Rhomboid family [Lysobacter silvestris]